MTEPAPSAAAGISRRSTDGEQQSPVSPDRHSPPLHNASGYEFLTMDPTNNGVPETPPYRRVASSSTLAVNRGMPPDYRSEYASSREGVNEAGASRVHLADEKSDYPKEKASQDDEITTQYATANTNSTRVHYPDTDGFGRLHNISPRGQRFPQTSSPTAGDIPFKPSHARSNSVASSDADDDQDETYDWSDEDDLVDEEAKFDKVMGYKKQKKGWGPIRFLTLFFSTLIGSTILSGALIAGGILVRLLWAKKDETEHRVYVADNVETWLFWAAANVTVSWFLASIIDALPHVFTVLVDIVWGTVSEDLKSRIELYQNGKTWVKPLFYGASMWVSWVILFEEVFKLYDGHDESQSRASYTPRVYQVIRFLFFLILVVCLEKVLIQVVAFSFHRTAFQDRLDAVTTATKVLDHLKDYKPKRRIGVHPGHHNPLLRTALFSGFRGHEPGSMEEGMAHHDGYSTDGEGDHDGRDSPARLPAHKAKKNGLFNFGGKTTTRGRPKRKDSDIPLQGGPVHEYPPSRGSSPGDGRRTPRDSMHSRAGSAEGGEMFMQAAKALKNIALHDARGIRTSEEDDSAGLAWGLNSAHEAKKLARNLYHTFRSDRKRTYLIPSDFYPAYRTPEEAREAFRVFDKDDNGDITRAEIKTAVMKVYRERRFLARSLRDVSTAVRTLDNIMLMLFLLVLVLISLPIFGIDITKSFTSFYTVFIAASFFFKNTAQNTFDSITFLFVTHPFDTGDRVFVDDENLVVRKMGLFATTFTRVDGSHTYYFNTLLMTKFINNARRSGTMAEGLELNVNWRTPQSKLDALEKRINEWIDSDERRWIKPGASIAFSKIDFQRALTLTIGIAHNGTWQDWSLRLARKTAFIAAVQYFCRELDITYSESPKPLLWTEPRKDVFETLANGDAPVPNSGVPRTPNTAGNSSFQDTTPREPVPMMLGFRPPHGPNVLRQRKSNKKKLLGASEGDADGM